MKLNFKYVSFFVFSSLLLMGMASCYDEKMEWGHPYGNVAASDLPLELQEKISRYEALTKYTDITLGVGIGADMYLTNETYRNLVNENFKEVTLGYEMKHAAIVDGSGNLNFVKVDEFIAAAKSAGLTTFGHTLVWHQNQNATYLNSLIAPTVLPGAAGSSLIDGDFESGLGGWNAPYYSEAITTPTDEAATGDHSMKVAVGDWGGSKYNMQINSPSFPIIAGHRYEISFFIKSDVPGSVGLDFPNGNLTNQYPWTDGKELTPTSSAWTKVTYNPTYTPDGMVATVDNPAMTFRLLLGSTADVTYYIDNVSVVDLDAEVNLVTNGDFESGDLTGWNILNAGDGVEVTNSDKYSGTYSVKLTSNSSSSSAWNLQLCTDELALDASKSYTFSFWVKSDVAGKGRISFPGGMDGNEYPWMDWTGSGASEAFTLTAGTWTLVSVPITNTSNVKLCFDMGYLPNVTYYIDDVKVAEQADTRSTLRSGPVIVEKTDEEKAQIIGDALEAWIKGMVEHFKADVHAWDVVNEPMSNSNGSALQTGVGETDLASDVFYWQDILGKDYAVTAFKMARQYGNASDKLFINDYNLESNPNKLDGLIAYVEYIESKGATVDGIGTQMHVSIDSDTTMMKSMFQKLAATGKLIKVSELDVRINTSAPTVAQYASQAEMYRKIAELFNRYVPESQRYGITVWCVSDNEEEHTNWLPDDAPCLWNADYQRKHAYKGFADGLAGRDVSADFSGEIQY